MDAVTKSIDKMLENDAATAAAGVCATVLRCGKHDGRFVMSIVALRRTLDLSERQTRDATTWAAERAWVRLFAGQVELKAAGIYVAKAVLDLPR